MQRTLLSFVSAILLLGTAPVALAQTAPTTSELEKLVRAQAAEIANLRARIDAVEGKVKPAPAATAAVTAAAAVPAASPVVTAAAPAAGDIKAEWGEGAPTLRSADGTWRFKLRGRVLMDVSNTSGSDFAARNDTTTGSRALRLGAEGGVGPNFFYQFESDFAENGVDVVTAFMGWRDKMSGGLDYDVRFGNLFNDRSMEGGTGSDATPFLERNAVAATIIPQRGYYGLGGQTRLFGPDWHLSLAVTGDDVDSAYTESDSLTVIGRGHWNPVKGKQATLHLGAWAFQEDLSKAAATVTRNATIGGRFNSDLRVSTGAVTGATSTTGYGAELGGFVGPVWAMAEAGERQVTLRAQPDFSHDAWSVSTGWFLTGETPPYNARTGNFTQPKVIKPVFDGGSGAWELTARYESLDFTDLATGGEGWAATAGVNWYLNNFTRLMLNGILWQTDNRAGSFVGKDTGQTVTMRAQVSF